MNYEVILGLQTEILGGVDVFTINLARGLIARGIPTRILFTKPYLGHPYSWVFPEDIPVDRLPVCQKDTWRNKWQALIHYLQKREQCIYIPNNDRKYSAVAPKFSKNVVVVGVVHSDEFFHYEHALRIGPYWGGIVAVSSVIANELSTMNHAFRRRISTIPYGVTVPDVCPIRPDQTNRPLRIVYVGRLMQRQKRVLDLLPIIEKLLDRKMAIEVTIIGDGPQKSEIEQVCSRLIDAGIVKMSGTLPNCEVLKELEQQDVILLTSDYEGFPICILEAMGRGCIPVVADIRSGIPELIKPGWNGFIVRHDDPETFADKIQMLQQNPAIRESMSIRAYETVSEKYQLRTMVDSYIQLFERCLCEANEGIYKRESGPIFYHPGQLTVNWKERLPTSIRTLGVFTKKIIRDAKRTLNQIMSPARDSL